MNDKLIEQKLRESFSPEPPAGMRERVLGRAGQELSPAQSRMRAPWFVNWRLAMATAGVLVVLTGNVSEYARDARLAALTNSGSAVHSRGLSIPDRAREIDCLLAANVADCEKGWGRGGSM